MSSSLDTENDNIYNEGHNKRQGDDVSGYTMEQIESALIGCNTWEKWKNNIKNKYNNKTKQYVDEPFASW